MLSGAGACFSDVSFRRPDASKLLLKATEALSATVPIWPTAITRTDVSSLAEILRCSSLGPEEHSFPKAQ